VAYALLVDRARTRDDVMELQRMWASEPENLKPFFVETLENALVEAAPLPAVPSLTASQLPVEPLGPPPEGPGTDLMQLANLVNMANAQM
jgi:hypothetical protein